MTTKKALILMAVIVVVALVVGMGLMFMLVDINSSGAEQQVAFLGQITGFVTIIPMMVVGIMWGLHRREQNTQKPTQSKARRQGRS